MRKPKKLYAAALAEQRKRDKLEAERSEQRKARLSAPITAKRILTFVKHLLAVSVGGEECWLYVGCTLDTTLKFKANGYPTLKFNGENVGPHQFALAASEGITLADLDGWDTHHGSEFGRCLGYRCCNPDHLEKVRPVFHRGTRGGAGTINPRHTRIVKELIEINPRMRRPVEQRFVEGAGRRQRFFAGIPFLIKLGDFAGIENVQEIDQATHLSTVLPCMAPPIGNPELAFPMG